MLNKLILLFLILSTIGCNTCRDVNCPVSAVLFHTINLVDSNQNSVYGSSTTQFDKAQVKITPNSTSFRFQDSLLIIDQYSFIENLTINYNDSTSTTISVNYELTSSRDECCGDFKTATQVLINGTPKCDTCVFSTVEI